MFPDIAPEFHEGERPSAGKLNRLSDMASQNLDPQSAYQDVTGMAQALPYPGPRLVMFELLEDLAQFTGDLVDAAVKTWDPTANGGDGGYTVDCADIIKVADFNEVGHWAGDGGFGVAEMHVNGNGIRAGTIIDLCCPGDEKGVCP